MEWSDEVRKAVDDLEEKYGIEVVSSEHNERIHKALLDSRAENKKLRDALDYYATFDQNAVALRALKDK